jgi:hypothetical protein
MKKKQITTKREFAKELEAFMLRGLGLSIHDRLKIEDVYNQALALIGRQFCPPEVPVVRKTGGSINNIRS